MADAKRELPSKRALSASRLYPLVTRIHNPVSSELTGQGLITLSYDDGLSSNFDLAMPLHEKYQIPATLNIIAGRLYNPKCFSVDMVKNAHRRGFEIASHCYTHDVGLTYKTDDELHFELGKSKEILSRIIGEEVATVALPFTQYDDRVLGVAKQYYNGVRIGLNRYNEIPPLDRYKITTAICIEKTHTFDTIKSIVDTIVADKKWGIIMLHGVNDAPVADMTQYEITPQLLEQVLQYVASFDRSEILPITTKDALRFTLGDGY